MACLGWVMVEEDKSNYSGTYVADPSDPRSKSEALVARLGNLRPYKSNGGNAHLLHFNKGILLSTIR